MTTFTWTITNLYTIDLPSEAGYVVNALYNIDGVDGEYSASISGMQQFEADPEKPDFVPFADLTNEIVVGWVQEAMGEDAISNLYACVDGMIESEKNPPVSPTNAPLPW
jgi:hypothetical protein